MSEHIHQWAEENVERVLAAAESGEPDGFCVACGAEYYGCEGDAAGYECPNCGEREVYGAEDLVVYGVA